MAGRNISFKQEPGLLLAIAVAVIPLPLHIRLVALSLHAAPSFF
jgi:hypothetical protein